MRNKSVSSAMLVLSVLALASCSGGGDAPVAVVETEAPTATTPAPVELSATVALGDVAGVRVLGAGKGTVVAADRSIAVSIDRSKAVVTHVSTGIVENTLAVPDDFGSPIVSSSGRFLALSTASTLGDNGLPRPRKTTSVRVYDRANGYRMSEFQLQGNVVPEAFSNDGQRLFVLDFVPADKPEYYRVRVVSSAGGRLQDTYERLKTQPADMSGIGHRAVVSPDRSKLFTLYSVPGPEGNAFVHTLSLVEGWNHCTDLPLNEGFGFGSPVIAIGDDGKQFYVVGAAGQIAEVDATERLNVVRTARLDGVPSGTAPRLAVTGDRLVVSFGTAGYVVDRATLKAVSTWKLGGDPRELIADARGNVVVGRERTIELLDVTTGKPVAKAEMTLKSPIELLAFVN